MDWVLVGNVRELLVILLDVLMAWQLHFSKIPLPIREEMLVLGFALKYSSLEKNGGGGKQVKPHWKRGNNCLSKVADTLYVIWLILLCSLPLDKFRNSKNKKL